MSAVQDEMRVGGDSRRGGRRSWARAEKSRIVDEAFRPGASAADVARGYGLNANQVFNWRRALTAPAKTKRRAAALTAPAEASAESQAAFVSVGMVVPTRDGALALASSPSVSVAGVMPLGATPDTFSRVFRLLDPVPFEACFTRFMQRFAEGLQGVVAIDGKTLRRSFDRAAGKSPLHMLHAWSVDQRLLLGQLAVDGKSNEITAVPKLLELLSLKGSIVTADALNCQRAIAAKVVAQGGDYVLALEGNQGRWLDDVRTFLDDPARAGETVHTTVDGDHGRIETRTSLVSSDISWLQEQHAWPGLAAIGKVVRTRQTGAKVSTDTAYYLLSTVLSAVRFGDVARAHWGVENGLHWVLDVTMSEDQARNRKDNGPQNIALLRRLALNLAKLEGSKQTLKGKLFRAALSDVFLTRPLAQFGRTQMR